MVDRRDLEWQILWHFREVREGSIEGHEEVSCEKCQYIKQLEEGEGRSPLMGEGKSRNLIICNHCKVGEMEIKGGSSLPVEGEGPSGVGYKVVCSHCGGGTAVRFWECGLPSYDNILPLPRPTEFPRKEG